MRAYLVDELSPQSLKTIAQALADKGFTGPIEDIYFLPLPEDLLDDEQREHAAECGPYVLPIETLSPEVGECGVRLEFLVRARNKLRCSCVKYASPGQRDFGIRFLDDFIRSLDISV